MQKYPVEDVVHILLQGEQDDSVAHARQIRDLSDCRKLMGVFRQEQPTIALKDALACRELIRITFDFGLVPLRVELSC